jgi:hypothetical protein
MAWMGWRILVLWEDSNEEISPINQLTVDMEI